MPVPAAAPALAAAAAACSALAGALRVAFPTCSQWAVLVIGRSRAGSCRPDLLFKLTRFEPSPSLGKECLSLPFNDQSAR